MIYKIINTKCNIEKIGNKAKSLLLLKENQYNVPNGIILDIDVYNETLVFNNKKEKIDDIVSTQLTKSNIEAISKQISSIFNKMILPTKLYNRILSYLDDTKLYAIRSSCLNEDLINASFAGQYDTYLNVKKDLIETKILNCYASMFNANALQYMYENKINFDNLKMAIIIQEMVPAEYSGVVFTINPHTGNDKEMVIDLSTGLGENIVDGKVISHSYQYNWYNERLINYDGWISKEILYKIINVCMDIQLHFGMPYDIEFAYCNNEIYILQARPITKIVYTDIKSVWTTANFKDTISATVSTPFMWSMYEYAFNNSLRNYILESKLLSMNEMLEPFAKMFYGRGYWNASQVKKALYKIPILDEEKINNSYGITTLENINKNKINQSLFKKLDIILNQIKILDDSRQTIKQLRNNLLYKYKKFNLELKNNVEIEKIWKSLTKDVFLKSESTYFKRIYINTIVVNLLKKILLKYISEFDYNNLISELNNLSHIRILDEEWRVSREIRKKEEERLLWKKPIEELKIEYLNGNLPYITKIINKFGYRSEKDLDITYPAYSEDVTPIIKSIKSFIELEHQYIDTQLIVANKAKTKETLKKNLSSIQYAIIMQLIDKIRYLLWWREEMRDVSTHFYYLIRQYTLKYATNLKNEGVIDSDDDIWMLKIGDLWDYIDGIISKKELRIRIDKNKKYYLSFKNFKNDDEIGSPAYHKTTNYDLKGIGVSSGIVTGVARIIESEEDLNKIKKGDILIARYTDTGWVTKYPLLLGIVTEYGGVLCHIATISRELGLPTIVCCENATKLIKDGQLITINSFDGTITLDGGGNVL